MGKIFYDHIVYREEIVAELDRHQITVVEREELIQLVDETLHHEILNKILSHLPSEKHEEFLAKLHEKPHDLRLLDYLEMATNVDIVEEIKKIAQKVKKEILSEIKRAKRK